MSNATTITETMEAVIAAPSFVEDYLAALHADTISGRVVPPCPVCGEPRIHALGCRVVRETGRFNVRLTSLIPFDPDDAGEFSEPAEADRLWAAGLNDGWHATGPSPEEAGRWDAETPADILDAEACYTELARRAEMAEEQRRVEAGASCW